jgi:hypothetical protein
MLILNSQLIEIKLIKLKMFHFTVKTKKYLTLPVKSFIQRDVKKGL